MPKESVWSKMFGKRKPLTREQEEQLRAEERLNEKRRKVLEDYRRFGKY